MKSWEIYTCDLGHGAHPVVIVAHPLRVAHKPDVDVVDCSSQRATRPAQTHEVILDQADGLDWPTVCKCDLVYTVPKSQLMRLRGTVTSERRRAIVSIIIQAHGWNAL